MVFPLAPHMVLYSWNKDEKASVGWLVFLRHCHNKNGTKTNHCRLSLHKRTDTGQLWAPRIKQGHPVVCFGGISIRKGWITCSKNSDLIVMKSKLPFSLAKCSIGKFIYFVSVGQLCRLECKISPVCIWAWSLRIIFRSPETHGEFKVPKQINLCWRVI